MYGLVIQFALNEGVGARLEWERYNDINASAINQGPFDVDLYSASLIVIVTGNHLGWCKFMKMGTPELNLARPVNCLSRCLSLP